MRLKKKHIAAIALSVAICVGATGCKSEKVKNTEKLIKEIDSTITLQQFSIIQHSTLTFEQKEAYCTTRLRFEVKDYRQVNEQAVKAAGATGIIRPGKNACQVIVGTNVKSVYDELDKLLK